MIKEIKELYLDSYGIDLGASHGNSDWELPLPATIITDAEGVVLHVFADTDYIKRMEPEEILEILKNN